jgi:hypothetical protein
MRSSAPNSNIHGRFRAVLSEDARLYWGLFFGNFSKPRERAKFELTGLANTGHVPSVRRAPQARNLPTQQVYGSALL